ncbi:MAG: magnesium transporter [Candidatus Thermoplasmatota archaeon]|nr:magnesium transporter [Candidatus Thermoplasmatota archaeon]
MERVQNISKPIQSFLLILASLKKIVSSKDSKESLFSLLLCTMGDLITGVIMGISMSNLRMLPALIILIPPAIGMRGNIFASLGSRLGTYLHTGQISPSFRGKILGQNVSSSFLLTILMSIYLGITATFTAKFLGMQVNIIDMILVSLLAGVLSAFFMLALTIATAFFSYRRGWDPDNVTTPIITLAGDIITLPLLFFSMNYIVAFGDKEKMLLFYFFIILGIASIIIPFSKISKPYCSRILMESTPIMLMGGLLGTLSGSMLGNSFEGLIGIAGILTMIPAFLEDGGAIGGILAAKFSSSLHVGSLECSKIPPREAQKLFVSMHIIGLIIFSLIGAFAFFISKFIGVDILPIHKMLIISVIAGEILIFIVNFVAYYSSIISFRLGIDPDNITIPTITSLMDIIGTGCLIFVLVLFGAI